ncbi:MAG: tetratricopeptide repeat protein [Planctomycetes bacterium]|nr:tetratricopeptide repeat protein [Planctomycetota bacterium]
MLLLFTGCEGPSNIGKKDRLRLDRIATIYEEGDTARAIIELENYLSTFPGDELAWTILGHAYQDNGRIDEAQTAYESALAIDPKQFQAITGLGIVHRKRGNYDAAMEAYERALEVDESYAQAYSSMTTIALIRREDQKALEYARKGYDLDKTHPVIAANLAIAYHYNDDSVNRDKFTRIAERLGYANVAILHQIYSGQMTVRD